MERPIPTSSGMAARPARVDPPGQRIKAITLMCIATAMFSGTDATAKYLGAHAGLPVIELVWLRYVTQFLIMLVALSPWGFVWVLRSAKPMHQMLRSVFLLGSTALNFLALRHLRLDQTVTIMFLTPLLVALLAGPFLGEWVGWRRLLAIMFGFLGMLVVVRPGFGGIHPAAMFSVGAMLCYASLILQTRWLSAFDRAEITLFYSMFAGVFGLAPFALAGWVWPGGGLVWLWFAIMGACAAVGHYLLNLAHRIAPASVLAPFVYTGLVSMSALGWLVFGDLPDQWTLLGGSIVIASGIYLVLRERKVKGL